MRSIFDPLAPAGAYDDPEWMAQLKAWTHSLPKPRGVLIVSAHWEAAPLMLSAPASGTPLVYDFGGFAPRYYTLTYPTPDAGLLAARVRSLMPDNAPAHQHPSRGLDHGAWVPLKVMYPSPTCPCGRRASSSSGRGSSRTGCRSSRWT